MSGLKIYEKWQQSHVLALGGYFSTFPRVPGHRKATPLIGSYHRGEAQKTRCFQKAPKMLISVDFSLRLEEKRRRRKKKNRAPFREENNYIYKLPSAKPTKKTQTPDQPRSGRILLYITIYYYKLL